MRMFKLRHCFDLRMRRHAVYQLSGGRGCLGEGCLGVPGEIWEFWFLASFLHFLGKIGIQEMSGKTPESPRHPSSRHPRPSEIKETPERLCFQSARFDVHLAHQNRTIAIASASALTEPNRQKSCRKKGFWTLKSQPEIANR